MATNISLVVLMGLPGAGKSTLCKTIISAAKKTQMDTSFIHICYDVLIPLSAQEKFAEAKKNGVEEETEGWKGARQVVYGSVDRLISCLKNDFNDPDVLKLFNIESVDNSNFVLLLDDNFYYRSMRYEYYQLARNQTVGFCQLFVDVMTKVAIDQNSERPDKVPTSVIHNMVQKLQPPKPAEHNWESPTLTVTSHNSEDLSALWDMIHQCMSSPVMPLENNERQKEEARLICSQNVAHQADLYLRSLVGKVIKEACSYKNAQGKKEFATRVNAARQTVMVAIRKGSVLFPPNLADVVDDNNREAFETFVNMEFQKFM